MKEKTENIGNSIDIVNETSVGQLTSIVSATMVETRNNSNQMERVCILNEKIKSIMSKVVKEEDDRFKRLNTSQTTITEESKKTDKKVSKLFFLRNFKVSLESELKDPKPINKESFCSSNDEKYLYTITGGKRIRPLLVMTGGLMNNNGEYGTELIEIATSVELIHKASVILDDLIDDDDVRSGKPSFHIKYGEKETLDYFHKLINFSQEKFNNVLFKIKKNDGILKAESLSNLYTEIINEMANGCIMDLNEKPKTEEETIIINDLQSSILLRNSLLLGYVSSFFNIKDIDEDTYSNVSEIGLYFGKIFQSFNDAEMFLQPIEQINLKGNINSDLVNNKKNIICSKIPVDLREKLSVEEQLAYIDKNNLVDATMVEIDNYINELKNRLKTIPRSTGKILLNSLFKKYLKKTSDLHSNKAST